MASRERGLSLTLDHKSTMRELRSLSSDSFDRRLSQKEKTGEAKKTLKRLDVRVLRIETAYAGVCLLACVTRREEGGGSAWAFVESHARVHVTAKPNLARQQQRPNLESASPRNHHSRQPCIRIAGRKRSGRRNSLV